MTLRSVPIVAAMAVALLTVSTTANAEVRKFTASCGGQLCPYFQIALKPPNGWMLDAQATRDNKVQILVPKGTSFNDAPALMYVQVFYLRDKTQSLTNFAETSNARWLAAAKDARISVLPAVQRVNGKEGFLRFAFENPGKRQQPYEQGAFGIDSDKDGNIFVLDVVLTGLDKAALDRVEKDYIAFLKAH
jgi:hypothetical protein